MRVAKRKPIQKHKVCGSMKELHRVTGISYSTLQTWKDRGDLPVRKDGKYSTKQLYDLLYEKEKKMEEKREEEKALGPSEEKLSGTARWREARAEMVELDLKEKRGELLSTSSVMRSFRDLSAVIRGKFHDFGSRVSPNLEMKKRAHIQHIIDEEMTRAFEDVQEWVDQYELDHPGVDK